MTILGYMNHGYSIPRKKPSRLRGNVNKEKSKKDNEKTPEIDKVRHYYDINMTSNWMTENRLFHLLADKAYKERKNFRLNFKDIYRLLKHNNDFKVFHRVYEVHYKLFEISNYKLLASKSRTILDQACYSGSLEIIEFLSNKNINKFYFSNYAIDNASHNGHLHIVKYLVESFIGMKCYHAIEYAAKGGYLELVKYIHKNIPRLKFTGDAINLASENGHFEVVKFLHQKNYKYSGSAINGAVVNGHTEIIKFFHNLKKYSNSFCTEKSMNLCAHNGHLETLKFLLKNTNGKCTAYAIDGAAFQGHLEVIKYLSSLDYSCTPQALNGAALGGHLEVVKYLLDKRFVHVDIVPPLILPKIVSSGHLEIFQLILNYVQPVMTDRVDKAYRMALEDDQLAIVQYLNKNNITMEFKKSFEMVLIKSNLKTLQYLSSSLETGIPYVVHQNLFRKIIQDGKVPFIKYLIEKIISGSFEIGPKPNYSSSDFVTSSCPIINEILKLIESGKLNSDIKFTYIPSNELVDSDNIMDILDRCIQSKVLVVLKPLLLNYLSLCDLETVKYLIDKFKNHGDLLNDRSFSFIKSLNEMINNPSMFSLKDIKSQFIRPDIYLRLLIKNSIISPLNVNTKDIIESTNTAFIKWWLTNYIKPEEYKSLLLSCFNIQYKLPILKELLKLPNQELPNNVFQIFTQNYNLIPLEQKLLLLKSYPKDLITKEQIVWLISTNLPNTKSLCVDLLLKYGQKLGFTDEYLSDPYFQGKMPEDVFYTHKLENWWFFKKFVHFSSEFVRLGIEGLFKSDLKEYGKSRELIEFSRNLHTYSIYSLDIQYLFIKELLLYYNRSDLIPRDKYSPESRFQISNAINIRIYSTFSQQTTEILISDQSKNTTELIVLGRPLNNQYYNETIKTQFTFLPFSLSSEDIKKKLKLTPQFSQQFERIYNEVSKLVDIETINTLKECFKNERMEDTGNKKRYRY